MDQATVDYASVKVANDAEQKTNIVKNPVPTGEVVVEKYHKLPIHDRFHVNDNKVAVGQQVSYELIVTNTRDDVAQNVVLEDPLPLNLINPTAITGTYKRANSGHNAQEDLSRIQNPGISTQFDGSNLVTWNLGDMEPGDKVTITFVVTVGNVTGTNWWINHAYLTYDNIGEEERFGGILGASASGKDSSEALVSDRDGEHASALQNRVDHDATAFAGIDLDLPVFHSTDAQTSKTPYVYTADVREFTQSGQPELEKTQQFESEDATKDILTVKRGGTITYYLTITNPDQTDLNNVVITDPIPVGLTYITGSASDFGYYDSATNSVIWPVGNLKAQDFPYTVSFKAEVPADKTTSTWTNQANMDWEGNPNPTPSNQVISETPELSIEKEQATFKADRTPSVGRTKDYIEFTPGETVVYYITVKNTSNVKATNVVISDPLPNGLTYIEGSATEGISLENGQLVWRLSELQPGNSQTVEVKFGCELPDVVTEKVYFRNTAYVNWDENGPNGPTPSNEVIIGDPPAQTATQTSTTPNPSSPGTPNVTNPTTTNTQTSSTQTASTKAPKTGTEGITLVLLLAGLIILSSAVLVSQKRRSKKKK